MTKKQHWLSLTDLSSSREKSMLETGPAFTDGRHPEPGWAGRNRDGGGWWWWEPVQAIVLSFLAFHYDFFSLSLSRA